MNRCRFPNPSGDDGGGTGDSYAHMTLEDVFEGIFAEYEATQLQLQECENVKVTVCETPKHAADNSEAQEFRRIIEDESIMMSMFDMISGLELSSSWKFKMSSLVESLKQRVLADLDELAPSGGGRQFSDHSRQLFKGFSK